MLATIVSVVVPFMITVGVVDEVVLPAGTYAYETGTELYQEYVVGTE